jgi:hypothetical protein
MANGAMFATENYSHQEIYLLPLTSGLTYHKTPTEIAPDVSRKERGNHYVDVRKYFL